MVMDLNKCIACQTCTVACKTTWTPGRGQEYMFWNNVESKPYGYYPLGWDVKILEKLGVQEFESAVYRGKTIFEAAPEGEAMLGYLPEDIDYAHPNIGEDDSAGLMGEGAFLQLPHMNWMYYLPRICNHCTYPACLAACPRQSIYKRPEDGIVLIDQARCRGYRECVRGCPYKKTFFNALNRTSEKCIGCDPAVENNRQTQCTITCIGKIRLQGFITTPDKASEDSPLDYLVHVAKVAKPLYPQFGLEPNVYYIPPIHVPTSFTRQLFGPGVDEAVKTYRNAPNDPDLAGLLCLFGSTEVMLSRWRRQGSVVAGIDEHGDAVMQVPLNEPVHTRPAYDRLYQIQRTNCP
jgi:nitrate reductase beta subunit